MPNITFFRHIFGGNSRAVHFCLYDSTCCKDDRYLESCISHPSVLVARYNDYAIYTRSDRCGVIAYLYIQKEEAEERKNEQERRKKKI